MKCEVRITKKAGESLEKMPLHIAVKLQSWIHAVENYGISKIRHIKGYHDEPLKGKRKGQRSIRLNKSYRAIYEEKNNHEVNIILIVEVNKHEY